MTIKKIAFPDWQSILTFSALLATLSVYVLMLLNLDRGLDVTDEGLYLVSVNHSEIDFLTTSHFHHYTGIVWAVVNQNISLFRAFGVVSLALSAIFLVTSTIKYIQCFTTVKVSRLERALWLSAACSSALVYYYAWLPSPSYNWLILVCCLCSIGITLQLVCATKRKGAYKYELFFLFLLGLVLTIAFITKPTTAVILGANVFLWIYFSTLRKDCWRILLHLALFVSVIMLSHAYFFENGLFSFITNMHKATEYANKLSGSIKLITVLANAAKDIIHIPIFLFENLSHSIYVILVLGLINIFHNFFTTRFDRYLGCLNLALLLWATMIAWWDLNTLHHWQGGRYEGTKVALGGVSILSVICLSALVSAPRKAISFKLSSTSKHFIALIASFALCSLAYGFGSSNGLMRQSSGAYVLWGLAAVLASYSLESNKKVKLFSIVVSFMVICSSFSVLKGAYNVPYRLGSPLSDQTYKITFIGNESILKVSKPRATYIENLKALALNNGWREQTTFIDMTGGTPLAAFILNGMPVKKAWLLGGYSGSESAARWLFEQIDIETIKQSWILTAPSGSRSIPTSVLEVGGVDFSEDFELVGELNLDYRGEKQLLWRPIIR